MALEISVSRDSDVPVGTQLAWKLKTLIATSGLAPREQLPGARELSEAVGVNVNTVRAVYSRLEEEGLLRSEHGRGTFVAERTPASDALARITATAIEHAHTAGVDPRDVAAALFVAKAPDPVSASAPTREDERRRPPGSAGPPNAERELRRQLRAQIRQLEGELAYLEPLATTPRPQRESAGRLLSAAELQSVRDALADRVAALRRESTAFRESAAQAREDLRRASEAEAERRRRTWAHSGASTGARVRPARVAWTHNW
jgi:DNA-binding transcriptional regulator YhcF (GntR family)